MTPLKSIGVCEYHKWHWQGVMARSRNSVSEHLPLRYFSLPICQQQQRQFLSFSYSNWAFLNRRRKIKHEFILTQI